MKKPSRLIEVERIILKAANVSIEQIHSKLRRKPIVDARHAIWYIAHEYFEITYTDLGVIYDRDHTTIIHGVEKLKKDGVSQKVLEELEDIYPHIMGPTVIDKDTMQPLKRWRF